MKKLTSLLLALLLLLALPLFAACKDEDPTPEKTKVNVWTLNGTTGFGMAQLMDEAKSGNTKLDYTFEVETKATNVRDALLSGDADIGAVPTNVAASLYNSSEGEVVLLALNTRGVLYLVVNTAKVAAPTSLADLAGKTVYAPAQNPTFITKALLDKAGVEYEKIDSSYTDPAELRTQVAEGNIDYAILPEPMVTIAKAGAAEGVTLTVALDLTEEWDKHFEEGSLVQGCVVARKAFVDANPDAIKDFLAEYKASIEYVTEHHEEAGQMIADAGIFAQAKVAQKALPKCNIAYIDGAAMKAAMEEFLAAMPSASIGGKLPAAGFYYGVE